MSANIRGITFAEQAVTPADDAIVRRAMLSDGILSGCSITYSGSTLTLAAGYMIACGRIFQITAARNWAVVDATSGVARLVLTIDLTKTATASAFNQIDFSIEYATAEDGFLDLTQEDINVAGTRYQVAVAVVSLGAGGITGIVSKLEKAEGGGGLNFKVVPGLTQPGSATENTIWVMTDKISGWIFSATQPEAPEEGIVWFSVGTSSPIEFNALRRNAIQVCPQAAKQFANGEWVDVKCMIYQNGVFQDWLVNLFPPASNWNSATNGHGSVDVNNDSVIMNEEWISAPQYQQVTTKKMWNVGPYRQLCAKIKSSYNSCTKVLALSTTYDANVQYSSFVAKAENDTQEAGTVLICDISSISGEYYVTLGQYTSTGASNNATIFDKVWME